jgi:hydroxyacylglutathione hydrolase
MDVRFVPTLKDNYSYLAVDTPSRKTLVIDPAEAEPVLQAIEEQGLAPTAIWITHHHGDHTGGIEGILSRFGDLPVVCSERDKDRVPHANRTVKQGDRLEFAGETAEVLFLPGHADGHIAFHFPRSGHLFAGDVLFGMSCGAVFDGSYDQMCDSVRQVKQLPPSTRIWCGHEYTGNNFRWAETVLGEQAIARRKASYKVPSIPLLLEEELATNAFLRLDSPEVQAYTGESDARAAFKALRQKKDKFS